MKHTVSTANTEDYIMLNGHNAFTETTVEIVGTEDTETWTKQLQKLPVAKLRILAKSKGLTVPSKATKFDLIMALSN